MSARDQSLTQAVEIKFLSGIVDELGLDIICRTDI